MWRRSWRLREWLLKYSKNFSSCRNCIAPSVLALAEQRNQVLKFQANLNTKTIIRSLLNSPTPTNCVIPIGFLLRFSARYITSVVQGLAQWRFQCFGTGWPTGLLDDVTYSLGATQQPTGHCALFLAQSRISPGTLISVWALTRTFVAVYTDLKFRACNIHNFLLFCLHHTKWQALTLLKFMQTWFISGNFCGTLNHSWALCWFLQ